MTAFGAILTNLTALLPQSRDCSYYVGQRIPAPPPPCLQKHTGLTRTRLRALFVLVTSPYAR